MLRITQVADGVHFAETKGVNWTLLTEGDSVTLVDAGYPADAPLVAASLDRIGRRPEQLLAVLVTHAHVDHIGGLPALLASAPGARVLTSEREARHARREFLEQATPRDVAANLWRPGVLPWALHIIRAGALKKVSVPAAEAITGTGPLDLPGRPVPVVTPGHTSGHTCYHLPDTGVLITGDALVTGHWTSRIDGPQRITPFFDHDREAAGTALGLLRPLPADILLPGHGPVHRGPVAEAVDTALGR
ncbi:MBL fold metallo-hydrolase [Actinocorallia longicatena]|uniref:MBL fold metallo-hydrolase n=1 Tax=Actinocorallia longicatena TaxID=111803 RepID=A0ABP6QKL1_9ACTN